MQEAKDKNEALEVVRSLNLIDDMFFHVFAEDKLAVQELLRVLMEDDELEVIVYHIKRVIAENGKEVYNGFREIYVNSAANDGSKIAELMQYLVKTDGSLNGLNEISRKCMEIQGKAGEQEMCEAVEKYAEKKTSETMRDVIKNLYLRNVDINSIAESTGKTIEEIKKIVSENC